MLKKTIFNRLTPFWLITFSVLIGLTVPTLIKDGMFMDALLYAGVSHNLSMGIGSFWFPEFSPSYRCAGLSTFQEHPPLVFGIQSVFFKIFGDSMYVERFYTFLIMCISAFLINLLWKEIFKNEGKLKNTGWLPLILWITIPVCFWSYSNNMQENTMGVFTLCAVLFIYKVIQSPQNKTGTSLLAGFFVFLAIMSKGVPGFFPIVVPFLFWLINRKSSLLKIILKTAVIAGVPVIIYILLFNLPGSSESLSFYVFKRVLNRIHEAPTVENRFYILYRLFCELLPQILLVTIFILTAVLKKVKWRFSNQIRLSVFFIAVGLSGSAPLMFTMVQKGFYFVPSLPFFAIGFSILIAPVILHFIEQINTKSRKFQVLLALSVFLFIGVISFSLMQKGKIGRDRYMLHDVYLIGKVLPKYTSIGCTTDVYKEYSLECYLIRYFNINLEISKNKEFYIIKKTTKVNALPGYERLNIKTIMYDLYRRQ